jgi:pseudaminic acid biosynthesis-associated methylase
MSDLNDFQMGELSYTQPNYGKTMNSQEAFWAGQFGKEYIKRNDSKQLLASNIALFSKILSHTDNVKSVVELGANIGMNLDALRCLIPESYLTGVEINQDAFDVLAEKPSVNSAIFSSALTWKPQRTWDMSLSKGVAIHIAPEDLPTYYQTLYNASDRYICLAEYYNPVPVEIEYRGHTGKLWKRDFAGEMLHQYPDLQMVVSGFASRHDANFPQDDLVYSLLRKG